MRRPPITAILTAGACALGVAAPAAAQDGAGQRYLAWPTKDAGASAPVAYVANPVAGAPRRRVPIIPHGGFGRMPDTAPAQNLTPASAWLGPNAPTYQPVPPPQPYAPPAPTPWSRDLTPPAPAYAAATAPAPTAYAPPIPTRTAPQPQPQSVYAPAEPPPVEQAYVVPAEVAPAPPPPVADTPPAPMPEAVPTAPVTTPTAYYAAPPEPAPPPITTAPALAPAPEPTPPAPEAPAFDPMAPRRDAPIFRLQRAAPSEPVAAPAAPAQPQAAPAPVPQAQAQAHVPAQPSQPAPQEGARYYSLHRQAGRQPDATPLPPTVYLDALPVELATPPASADLAEPPAQPALIRNANGRLQAAPDTEVQDQP